MCVCVCREECALRQEVRDYPENSWHIKSGGSEFGVLWKREIFGIPLVLL